MSILAEGIGTWDGTITNPANPQRRDTQHLLVGGYIVIQFEADNPGVWPFHCRTYKYFSSCAPDAAADTVWIDVAWHVSGGLYVNVMERPDDIMNIDIPSSLADTCRQWEHFTDRAIPDQIDSGE
jgi:hypothetical protein